MTFKPKTASIVYYVTDITRTEAFYNQTLGLELTRMEGAEPFWLQGRLSGGLELVFFQMPAKRGDSPAIVFNVEAPGGWSADFLDPDGFGLGLWQPEDKPRSLEG